MDFFAYQDRARRNSARLLLLFALAVIAIIAAVNLVALVLLPRPSLVSTLVISTATLLLIVISSLVRIGQLRAGGGVIAARAGAVVVPLQTDQPLLRRYRNVAEEMAIAAGIAVPQLFVLEDDPGINAFAAGYGPSDAAVVVTRGALERLNRDELQAVVAHELAHVLNGDMRLNIQLMGVLFGILMLSVMGKRLIAHSGMVGRGQGRPGLSAGLVVVLLGLAGMAIGSVGVLFARLIKAAVSRQREVLADASAVQFTRQSKGLAGALKKIGGLDAGSQLRNRAAAEEVSHMLFGPGLGLSRWFATHPPLIERIALLEPGFSGVQLQVLRRRWAVNAPDGLAEDVRLGLAGGQAPVETAPVAGLEGSPLAVAPRQVSAQVANPGCDDYRQAARLLQQLPAPLHDAARDREQAPALVLALLLASEPALARAQLQLIGNGLGEVLCQRVQTLRAGVTGLHPGLRLPLAAMAFPALRRNPRPQLHALVAVIDAVVHAEGQVELFQYCLARLLRTQVIEALDPAAHTRFGRRAASSVQRQFCTLLSVVAWAGHPGQPEHARRAYLAGMGRVLTKDHLPYLPPPGVQVLDAVWPALDALEPLAKQVLVEALTATIALDGRTSVAEAELLRLVCAVLHCPLPALLQAEGQHAQAS